MKRLRNTLAPLVAHHGCDAQIAEEVLAGHRLLRPSDNDYDWLGPGIYFWVDSAERGLEWAQSQSQQSSSRKASGIKKPGVIGALVYPGLCLNLTDYGVMEELREAHRHLTDYLHTTQTPLPVNTRNQDGVFLRRPLDCAVIRTVHQLREEAGLPPYDTVYGVFEEGPPAYPGAGFRAKTHVQIAVRNPDCIVGYFRAIPSPD